MQAPRIVWPVAASLLVTALLLSPPAVGADDAGAVQAEEGNTTIQVRPGERHHIVIRSEGLRADPRFERHITVEVERRDDRVEIVRSESVQRRDYLRQRPREHPRRHHRDYRPFRGAYDVGEPGGDEIHLHLHFEAAD